ncbi:MAG: cyclic pyranopterin monophosphate synthase MoaC [Acidimicrobiia bacterium]|nr:cyclic pyranopterin monophosphate synthase MoaC [Acidimicrobiia bacterium]MBT8213933.1 cyclic pyranopterin monophosphate synthase MoaC [Acidimicrobiia bacterium]NNF68294.1 cyclic pyranopterin monophosphate synthase MoaC [Acidimicrobiia bacterium]NNK90945.1 cyclic pyranopterin monophosphate synthase MoaC [Acidimicrobiia bacterium]NNL96971.1 cyclic pyranopterin monophosphate synthase MoaC [Acidimicrobiia bacterium]
MNMSHLDDEGRARMVDVGDKATTARTATAEALLSLSPEVADVLFSGALPKGDALAAARIAGISAAKKTPDLIPLAHPIALSAVTVDVERVEGGARVVTTARATDRTGVEMEALTAAAVAALTLYDMVKGMDRGPEIGPVRLIEKTGGASGDWHR